MTANVSGGLFKKRPCRGRFAACSRILKWMLRFVGSASEDAIMHGLPVCDSDVRRSSEGSCRSGFSMISVPLSKKDSAMDMHSILRWIPCSTPKVSFSCTYSGYSSRKDAPSCNKEVSLSAGPTLSLPSAALDARCSLHFLDAIPLPARSNNPHRPC